MSQQQLNKIKEEALKDFAHAKNSQELYQLKVNYLGKTGALTEVMKLMASLPKEEKPQFGQMVNQVKSTLETSYAEYEAQLKSQEIELKMLSDCLDLTMPFTAAEVGSQHPIQKVTYEIFSILARLGYSLRTGPMIEKDY